MTIAQAPPEIDCNRVERIVTELLRERLVWRPVAASQAAHAGENPVLIPIETRGGHEAGKPTSKIIDEIADKWAFLVRPLNVDTSGAY